MARALRDRGQRDTAPERRRATLNGAEADGVAPAPAASNRGRRETAPGAIRWSRRGRSGDGATNGARRLLRSERRRRRAARCSTAGRSGDGASRARRLDGAEATAARLPRCSSTGAATPNDAAARCARAASPSTGRAPTQRRTSGALAQRRGRQGRRRFPLHLPTKSTPRLLSALPGPHLLADDEHRGLEGGGAGARRHGILRGERIRLRAALPPHLAPRKSARPW